MKIKAFFPAFSGLLLLAACSGGVPAQQPQAVHTVQQKTIELEQKEQPAIPSSISITAIGDVLLHSSIYTEAKKGAAMISIRCSRISSHILENRHLP